MLRSCWKPLLLAAATIFSTTAAASSTGRLAISNLTFTLIDLDLTDGVTPSLIFGPMSDAHAVGFAIAVYQSGGDEEYFYAPAPDGSPITISFQHPSDSVSIFANWTGREQFSTNAVELVTEVNDTQHGYTSIGLVSGDMRFILSQNTRVVFEMFVESSASIDRFNPNDSFSANAAFILDPDGSAEAIAADEMYRAENEGSYPSSFEVAKTISLSYENQSDTEVSGTLQFAANTHATSGIYVPPPPIPEPSTLPMLATGFTLIGLARFRRAMHC